MEQVARTNIITLMEEEVFKAGMVVGRFEAYTSSYSIYFTQSEEGYNGEFLHMAGLWEAYTASTTGQKLVIGIILMEEGEQRQVVRPGQDYTDSNTIAQEISRHQGLNWQQFTFTTLVLDGGIVQFKLEESVGPVNVYTDDITSTLWLLGNNTLMVEGVMQDVLAYLGPKWDLGYAEISKEGVQFEAYISSYTIIITPMEEGYIKQWQLMGMEKITRQQELDLQCVVTRSVKTFRED